MFDTGNQRSVLGLSNEVWKVFCILTIQRVIASFQICVEKKSSFFARDCSSIVMTHKQCDTFEWIKNVFFGVIFFFYILIMVALNHTVNNQFKMHLEEHVSGKNVFWSTLLGKSRERKKWLGTLSFFFFLCFCL